MLAINPAIFWKLLYNSITKVLKTGQSKGNFRYKLLEILRGHTQEVIIINFCCCFSYIVVFLIFNNSSSFDLNWSVLSINNLNFSSQAELNMTNKKEKRFRAINQNFSSYLAGLFEGDGCIWIYTNDGIKRIKWYILR